MQRHPMKQKLSVLGSHRLLSTYDDRAIKADTLALHPIIYRFQLDKWLIADPLQRAVYFQLVQAEVTGTMSVNNVLQVRPSSSSVSLEPVCQRYGLSCAMWCCRWALGWICTLCVMCPRAASVC